MRDRFGTQPHSRLVPAMGLLLAGMACSAPAPDPLYNISSTTRAAGSDALPAVHDRATGEFPLPHGGAPVPCTDCHWDSRRSRMDYALTASCNSARCHDGDHVPTLGARCIACHAPGHWEAARFDYAKPFPAGGSSPVPGYPLRGKHASLRCDACHHDHRDFTSATTSCVGCHAGDDVHGGARGVDCQRCHGEDSWRR